MDSTLALLTEWLPRQRWFTATGAPPQLRMLADVAWPSPDPAAAVHNLIVTDDASATSIVYQIPVVVRASGATADRHLVGRIGSKQLVDGPHDPAFTTALLRMLAPDVTPMSAEVLSGEQSNTSVIYRLSADSPIICKIFRQLDPGLNPDIELQSALAGANSPHVPQVFGSVEGEWPDPRDREMSAAGSLVFAQEFLPGVQDAWRVALRAAQTGQDFTTAAAHLGRATAAVHLDLARLLATSPADGDARASLTAAWDRRLKIAITEVPPLASHRVAIERTYATAAAALWPDLQRIHGDYHLGQVLDVPERGWVLLDFEGEPMRPMRERRLPDLALRDIAGMLRSFDYVAGSSSLERPDEQPALTRWALEARAAFLAAYRDVTGDDPSGPLLDALELDKAVYEAIYESRHRPDWLSIPLAAIERLTAR